MMLASCTAVRNASRECLLADRRTSPCVETLTRVVLANAVRCVNSYAHGINDSDQFSWSALASSAGPSGEAYFKKDDKTAGLFQKSRQPLLRPGPLLQKNRQTAIAPGAEEVPGRYRAGSSTTVKKLTKTQAFGH